MYSEKYFYTKILQLESHDEMRTYIDKEKAYNQFETKVNGKTRHIDAIDRESGLYLLQRRLLDNFLCDIPLPDCVCGFVKGKSYLDFLTPHCNKKFYLRLDIKDFFSSLKVEKVKEVLMEYVNTTNIIDRANIINAITYIVTFNRSLPQGAVTSPQLSNIIFRRLDIRIRKYCRKFNITYTRYADDLLFSSNSDSLHKESFYKMIVRILKDLNLRVNKKKIRKSEEKLVLNGYVIGLKISLSRNKLKNINSLIYSFENYNGRKSYPKNFEEFAIRLNGEGPIRFKKIKNTTSDWNVIINYLAGYRSYLLNFSKEKYNTYCKDYSKKVNKIENMLEKIIGFQI
ncbi:reverse transcriptase family protein [Lysinibacillus sphaericus]|uniref:reverse transcriptase family protein n=1 Tax=Lysinibacillus sphaericus TaxID=1421 RepID=UPI0025A301AA|nr:reverse transcriptase family protein [Lysinibacillus sphaericus]MDM5352029.1 reverse transcriptase family protein [Lysinibacillus sphaericus]